MFGAIKYQKRNIMLEFDNYELEAEIVLVYNAINNNELDTKSIEKTLEL